ncbi:hypothetical protein M422DRAFT_784719 [Sphaerobolus stellatus SS14]|uniref:F-box domain-containing protein n=1 Tax=Sphaerobolus stellatus (strain SS14) TaxID=990650 RepID=A0A0C9UFZ2_SPHS4|nr:hypothetical protein M422DRAFT_784719 [Sphaerobolus stellatus SS14]
METLHDCCRRGVAFETVMTGKTVVSTGTLRLPHWLEQVVWCCLASFNFAASAPQPRTTTHDNLLRLAIRSSLSWLIFLQAFSELPMTSTRTPILPIELLELVFSFCSKSTVFSSCLVSKLWLQPALNVLWKDVPHPEFIFRLLTPWVTGRLELSAFRRNLRLADWKRCDCYASRVRSLRWMEIDEDIADWIAISFAILAEVARIRPRFALLPCLRSLFINTEHMEYMSLFLHPALTDLVIGFEPYYTDGSGIEGVCDIFLLLPDMAPGLQSLQINCSYRVSELSPPLGSVLRALSSLRKISLPRYWLSDWVINILGSLPRLEQFDWDYDRGEGALEDLVGFSIPLQDHSFPALSRIKMELDFPVVQTFLGQVHFSND